MPPIEGKNWNAEVVDRSFKREKIRNEFYEKLAKLKLGIETNPETVLANPSASGLKTHEELTKASEFSSETEKGSTLSAILHSYFKENVGVTDAKTRGREVALSLYSLTRQKDTEGRAINVDYLNLKWKIEIKSGQLFISNQKGEKVVDGAYLRKPAEGAAAAAAPAGEAGELSEAAGRFVTRIREKSKEKKSLDEILGKVQEGLNVGRQKIDAIIETATPDEIADSTNAWRAWTRQGFLKGPENLELRKSLQKFIFDSEEEIPAAHKKYARQLWRTEMVSHISKKLDESNRTDTPIVMEKIMGSMRVTDSEDEPAEALKKSMFLDPKFRDRETRQKLAKQMDASDKHGEITTILSQLKFFKAGETNVEAVVKVVVGGDFISIPAMQASNFKYKHAVFIESENRIYAQMENGCMGNLVIIEKVPVPAPEPPAPPPGPRPPEPPPGPGPGPGPEPPPGPDIPEGGGKTPVPPKPSVPEGGGRTPVPPKPGVPEGGGKTPIPPKPVVPEGGGKTPVPPKPTVPEGSGKTTIPPRPVVPEGGGRTAVPPRPSVPEGSGRTVVPPKPVVPEGEDRTPVPPKPAPAPVPEGSGRTAVPPRPSAPEGSGRTAIPHKPGVPEGSGRTAVPPKPTPAPTIPEGGGKTAVPAKPAPAPAPIPEGSGRTAIPPKPAPAAPPEGGGRTAVPARPATAPVPEGSGKTVVPPKPATAPLPPPEGSEKTIIPAKPAPAPPMPTPEGSGKTAIPARPAPTPPPIPEGGGRTTIPAKPAPIPPPAPEGAGRTAVPTKPAPAPPAPPPEGGGRTAVPARPAPAVVPEGGGKTAVPPLDEGEPVKPPE